MPEQRLLIGLLGVEEREIPGVTRLPLLACQIERHAGRLLGGRGRFQRLGVFLERGQRVGYVLERGQYRAAVLLRGLEVCRPRRAEGT